MQLQYHPPEKKELRSFGLIFAAMLSIMFGAVIPWLFDFSYPRWPWLVSVAIAIIAVILPIALLPLYRVWMFFGAIMAWINTRIILGAVFYLMIFPISLIIRLFGRDPMRRKTSPNAETYRQYLDEAPGEGEPGEEKKQFERPF